MVFIQNSSTLQYTNLINKFLFKQILLWRRIRQYLIMKTTIPNLIASFICLTLLTPVMDQKTNNDVYRNPVIDVSVPDPTIVRAKDGSFYLYGTENIRNVPIYKSDNLIDWQFVGTAFTDETHPK